MLKYTRQVPVLKVPVLKVGDAQTSDTSKDKAHDPRIYRGLQISSSLCKMLIVARLKTWYEQQLLDQHQCFRSD